MRASLSAALLAGLVVVACSPGAALPTRIETSSAGLRRLLQQLEQSAGLSGVPPDAEVHTLVYVFPAGEKSWAPLEVRRSPGARLSPVPTVGPEQARSRPGLYLGVLDPNGEIAWLVPVADPRHVLGEGVPPSEPGDRLAGGVFETREGALAARFPLPPGATVFLYESVHPTEGQRVTKIHFMAEFGRTSLPEDWAEFEVMAP